MKNDSYILMLIIVIVWGSFAAVSKLVLGNLDSYQVQFYLYIIAFIIMSAMFLCNGKYKELKKLTLKQYLSLSLYSIPSFLYYFLFYLGLEKMPTIEVSMLNYLFPVFIVILAVPINKEKLSFFKIVSVLIGFLGVTIIITGGQFNGIRISNLEGAVIVICSALSWALFTNLSRKNDIDITIANYIYITYSLIYSLIAILIMSKFALPGIIGLSGLLWISVTNFILSYYLWFRILRTTPVILVSSLSFITPFFSLLFISVFLKEKITFIHISGLLIILAAAAIHPVYSILKKK